VIVAAVPVKDLGNAKQRLMRMLASAERAELARVMLRDVLRALALARLDSVWLVTRDPDVAAVAAEFHVTVLVEDDNRGHTAAVARAQAKALASGARLFVTVPGDVPCVRPEEIDALTAAASEAGVAFTPSRSGLGTNGAALAPPDVMALTFGEPSFENHLATARRGYLAPRVLHQPGLSLDIDDPSDLQALLAEGRHTETGRLLDRWAIAERFPATAAVRGSM
jgi:2-phospho-L-lactate guanylyltransferase